MDPQLITQALTVMSAGFTAYFGIRIGMEKMRGDQERTAADVAELKRRHKDDLDDLKARLHRLENRAMGGSV